LNVYQGEGPAMALPFLPCTLQLLQEFCMRRRLFTLVMISLCLVYVTYPQTQPSQAIGPRVINGQIRLEGRPAPQGVLVLLDQAPGRDTAPASRGELSRTGTDSSGRFTFTQVESMPTPGNKLYAVTAHYPGYLDAFQVVDMTFSRNGYVNLDLKRDTSKDTPNVPPGGAGATVNARQPASTEAQEALAKGQELLLRKGDPRHSISSFKKVVKIDPQYAPAYLLLGTAYMQTKEYGEAQSAFEKVSKLEPANATAFLGIGATLNQQGEFLAAQKPLMQSLALNPNSAEAQYELGRSYWGLGKWKEAAPHVRKSLAVNREFAVAHVLMGNVLLREKNGNSALSEFQEYLHLAPDGEQAAAVRDMVTRLQKALAQGVK
jgi:tetratricopeptide (TPR) repeat protein